jgi:APA family basic amino acid/polyamine antiporter
MNPANHTRIFPRRLPSTAQGITHPYGGIMGILGAAGRGVFFAFIGFDAVSTALRKAKNPKRDMPIGISDRWWRAPSSTCCSRTC